MNDPTDVDPMIGRFSKEPTKVPEMPHVQKTTKPFSPAEALNSKDTSIPEEIIAAVNTLLSTRFSKGRSAKFTQDEVMAEALKNFEAAGKAVTRGEVYENHWMDFEPLFEKRGWKVVYDKPAYCETYDANFTFSEKS